MRAILAVLLFAVCSNAFRFHSMKFAKSAVTSIATLRMAEEESTGIVPVDKVNVESAGSVTGGILGFVLGGPVLAALFAAVTNYVIKKDGESGEALRGLGKTVVESYNFLTKLNTKYGITEKVTDSIGKAISGVEVESEALQKVTSTYATVSSKVSELNQEYDLVSKGKEVIAATAALSDAAIEKVIELNDKYDFVATTKKAVSTAVDKVKEQSGSASSSS